MSKKKVKRLSATWEKLKACAGEASCAAWMHHDLTKKEVVELRDYCKAVLYEHGATMPDEQAGPLEIMLKVSDGLLAMSATSLIGWPGGTGGIDDGS